MSTIVEIQNAIARLSPSERAELESLIWPDWDRPDGDTPPGIHDKLSEAEKGRFMRGDRANIKKILSSLE